MSLLSRNTPSSIEWINRNRGDIYTKLKINRTVEVRPLLSDHPELERTGFLTLSHYLPLIGISRKMSVERMLQETSAPHRISMRRQNLSSPG